MAIAAGVAQFVPATQQNGMNSGQRKRTPGEIHSMLSRGSGTNYGSRLLSASEPKLSGDDNARRTASDHNKHRRSKLRVDAFLGEWLNPEYFEHITPPPPSALMVATAKAELLHNETIDVFTPSITTKSSHSSLWGGTSSGTRPQSRDSALEDWDDFNAALSPPHFRHDRTSSYSSIDSSESSISRRLGYRLPQSTIANAETVAYAPPVPTYALSTTSNIPKGYVAHAKSNCVNVDYQWDSSREPQDWGDGGEFGEEWSLMHRRFRKGLTNLIYWYSRHNADDRGEDALGLDQADRHGVEDDEGEEEELVVILVTHGAGCNALIGALTGQPVLMDVGMASLTMAVRKEDAPPASILVADTHSEDGRRRRGSLDGGLTQMYDMKIVASSEHLRPGYDPLKFAASSGQRTVDPINRLKPFRGDSLGPTSMPAWSPAAEEPSGRSSMSTALGSIRRPTSSYFPPQVTSNPSSKSSSLTPSDARDAFSAPHSAVTTPSSWAGGLWTPPEARTPYLAAQYMKDERRETPASLNEAAFRSNSVDAVQAEQAAAPSVLVTADDSTFPRSSSPPDTDQVTRLETLLDEKPPQALSRGLSQEELWKARPSGDVPKHDFPEGPKRRWTFTDEQQAT